MVIRQNVTFDQLISTVDILLSNGGAGGGCAYISKDAQLISGKYQAYTAGDGANGNISEKLNLTLISHKLTITVGAPGGGAPQGNIDGITGVSGYIGGITYMRYTDSGVDVIPAPALGGQPGTGSSSHLNGIKGSGGHSNGAQGGKGAAAFSSDARQTGRNGNSGEVGFVKITIKS